MPEEQDFEVVDRRRTHAQPEAERAEPESSEDEDEFGGLPPFNPLLQMNVGAVLRMTAGFLNDKAWISMGLHPDPMTNKVEKNLPEARRAIDALSDLVKHIELDAPAEEKREIQLMLSNLRINFVNQSK